MLEESCSPTCAAQCRERSGSDAPHSGSFTAQHSMKGFSTWDYAGCPKLRRAALWAVNLAAFTCRQ